MEISKSQKLILPVKGMTCAACVLHVENAIKSIEGVSSVVVNLSVEDASVEFNPGSQPQTIEKTSLLPESNPFRLSCEINCTAINPLIKSIKSTANAN